MKCSSKVIPRSRDRHHPQGPSHVMFNHVQRFLKLRCQTICVGLLQEASPSPALPHFIRHHPDHSELGPWRLSPVQPALPILQATGLFLPSCFIESRILTRVMITAIKLRKHYNPGAGYVRVGSEGQEEHILKDADVREERSLTLKSHLSGERSARSTLVLEASSTPSAIGGILRLLLGQ